MKLLDDQLDEASLARLGNEAVELLCAGRYQDLANKFGYAVAFDRDPASAIEADLKLCLSEKGLSQMPWSSRLPSISVRYCQPNSTNLVALTECKVPVKGNGNILVELIVTSSGEAMHITLEDMSSAI